MLDPSPLIGDPTDFLGCGQKSIPLSGFLISTKACLIVLGLCPVGSAFSYPEQCPPECAGWCFHLEPNPRSLWADTSQYVSCEAFSTRFSWWLSVNPALGSSLLADFACLRFAPRSCRTSYLCWVTLRLVIICMGLMSSLTPCVSVGANRFVPFPFTLTNQTRVEKQVLDRRNLPHHDKIHLLNLCITEYKRPEGKLTRPRDMSTMQSQLNRRLFRLATHRHISVSY